LLEGALPERNDRADSVAVILLKFDEYFRQNTLSASDARRTISEQPEIEGSRVLQEREIGCYCYREAGNPSRIHAPDAPSQANTAGSLVPEGRHGDFI
jgi:hypothetical protein